LHWDLGHWDRVVVLLVLVTALVVFGPVLVEDGVVFINMGDSYYERYVKAGDHYERYVHDGLLQHHGTTSDWA